jgi:hypothetical protein
MELVHTTRSFISQSPKAAIVTAVSCVVAATCLALLIAGVSSSGSTAPAAGKTPPRTSLLSGLSPQSRQYVLGITRLTPVQLAAAFGTGSVALPWLTPEERRYVDGIGALTPAQLAAAFGRTGGRAGR